MVVSIRPSWRKYLLLSWDGLLTLSLVVLSVLLLVSPSSLVVFRLWQTVAGLFICSTLTAPRVEHWAKGRWRPRWAGFFLLLAGLVGMQYAVWALLIQNSVTEDLETALVAGRAAVGVLLSWLLIHTGFADVYAMVDQEQEGRAFSFPGEKDPTNLKYVYLAVTVGTSFAVSDVAVLTRRARTIVIIHSVVSFCYNALVVAVAFQVLQKLVTSQAL